jgi:cytochrome c-type biogenesis protein CcmH
MVGASFGPATATRIAVVLGLAALALALVVAGIPRSETSADRVARLAAELRCPVCQGLSVADSPSDTAREMRGLIAQRVAEGRTDDEIRAEFRRAYGDWIFLSPPLFDARGAVWLVPLVVVIIGFAVIAVRLARVAPSVAPNAEQMEALRRRELEEAVE